jgi:tRNA(Ile)-lysidine synthase
MLNRLPTGSNEAPPLTGEEVGALLAPAFSGFERVLLAVSGGADSVALLVLAAEWSSGAATPELLVATVDQGLRPEAAVEAAAVAALCRKRGLAHAILAAAPVEGSTRVEEQAREARYAALTEHARAIGAAAIVTAHTLDDQAETVLLRLAAGSGPMGLAAMRERTLRDELAHLRPFLAIPKARLIATLRARNVAWAEDSMNADLRFARARLRGARAALEREGLTAARLATLARRLARAEDALEATTADAAALHLRQDEKGWALAAEARALPAEIRLRLLARAVAAAGGGRIRLERLERLAERIAGEAQGAATLAGARIAWRADGTLLAAPAPLRAHGARRSPGV